MIRKDGAGSRCLFSLSQRSTAHFIKPQNLFLVVSGEKQQITKGNTNGLDLLNLTLVKNEALAIFRGTEHFQT